MSLKHLYLLFNFLRYNESWIAECVVTKLYVIFSNNKQSFCNLREANVSVKIGVFYLCFVEVPGRPFQLLALKSGLATAESDADRMGLNSEILRP
jgi:hypothetical protein